MRLNLDVELEVATARRGERSRSLSGMLVDRNFQFGEFYPLNIHLSNPAVFKIFNLFI